MRLRGIDDMAAGNAYLPEFMTDFNRRFAVVPRNAADAHRPVLHDARELDLILCEQHARTLTKNLALSFEGRTYQVTGHGKGLPAARREGHRVPGARRRGDGAARRPGTTGAVARAGPRGAAGGGRQDGAAARRPDQGGAALATGPQAGARLSLAAAIQAGGAGRRLNNPDPFARTPRAPKPPPQGPDPQGDISELERRGHFCFALTHPIPTSTPRAQMG